MAAAARRFSNNDVDLCDWLLRDGRRPMKVFDFHSLYVLFSFTFEFNFSTDNHIPIRYYYHNIFIRSSTSFVNINRYITRPYPSPTPPRANTHAHPYNGRIRKISCTNMISRDGRYQKFRFQYLIFIFFNVLSTFLKTNVYLINPIPIVFLQICIYIF